MAAPPFRDNNCLDVLDLRANQLRANNINPIMNYLETTRAAFKAAHNAQDAHTLRQLFLYDNFLEVDLPPVLEGSDCFIFM